MSRIIYKYQDMPNKSVEGIHNEVVGGLAKMAVFFETTYGLPHELFYDRCQKESLAMLTLAYLDFRNEHPELWQK